MYPPIPLIMVEPLSNSSITKLLISSFFLEIILTIILDSLSNKRLIIIDATKAEIIPIKVTDKFLEKIKPIKIIAESIINETWEVLKPKNFCNAKIMTSTPPVDPPPKKVKPTPVPTNTPPINAAIKILIDPLTSLKLPKVKKVFSNFLFHFKKEN